MFKKIVMSLMLTAAFGAPQAFAHGVQQQPSLLGALVNIGNHGGIANVAATVGATPSYRAPTASVADVKANVLGGAVKADVAVGQTSRQGSSLLGLNLSILGGGVGNRQDRW
ncbi:MAG TPA: hypothetical protein VGC16_03550 [Rhizomicrobium sp.]